MQISDAGVALVKSFEGYLTLQKDGSCVAYLCPAKVPTIGWGCTEGVSLGMRWSAAEAESGLRRELAKFEAGVSRLVTVEINQNEFDALVSFSYNVGLGALQKSSLLKKLNAGDRAGAAAAFGLWNKGGGKVLNGLVARRAREAALFLKPVSAPDAPWMPQKVQASNPPLSAKVTAAASSMGTAGVATVAAGGIPAPPGVVDSAITSVGAWQGVASKAVADPLVMVGLAVVAAIFVVPWVLDKWRDA